MLRPLLLVLLLLGCARIPEDAAPGEQEERADQVFRGGRITLHQDELMRAEIEAGLMEQYRRQAIVQMMDSVQVVTWDSLGRIESILLCDTLYYQRDRQDMQAVGHVRVLAASDPQGRRLEQGRHTADKAGLLADPPFQLITERLEWVQRIQKIQTELPVVFYTPMDTLRGTGFRSDRNLRNWEIDRAAGVSHRRKEGGS